MADEEFHDQERSRLIEKIHDHLGLTELPAETWAMLWLSDMNELQSILRVASNTDSMIDLCTSLSSGYADAKVSKKWLARVRPSSNTSAPAPTAIPRDPKLTGLCLERDNYRCLITDAGLPLQVAHIYPHSLGSQADRSFWRTLSRFWSADRIEKWKQKVCGDKGTETLYNRISLAPHAHGYWGRAMFAIKPIKISDDGKTLFTEFYWMPSSESGNRGILSRPTISNNATFSGDNVKLFNNSIEKVICSGTPIEFHTDNPLTMPLPSIELLQMQWILHRVAALSGAGEDDDDDDDDGDDYGDDDDNEDNRGRPWKLPVRQQARNPRVKLSQSPGGSEGSEGSERSPVHLVGPGTLY